jgi:hypothetical protein
VAVCSSSRLAADASASAFSRLWALKLERASYEDDVSNINTRNIPDDLYHRVRAAAAMGGSRIPKGALERFVIRALRRAVEDPQPGAGLPLGVKR